MAADHELPDELVDQAAERLLDAGGGHAAALQELIASHAQYELPLRQLYAALLGTEQVLDSVYPGAHGAFPQLGGHRVIRRLGEGAFGVVYLCAQERPVVRQVAIKVLRPGAGDERTLQRFAAERQLLAQLNHPVITQVYDAGELADGRPYFVMEYVDGTPIRSYCAQRQLSCRERLRLFMELCRGLVHAHARGIVHRDLKPANVLVTETEDGPVPKIIDFGVAKALHAEPRGCTPRTDAGRVIGTPGYMSPEQAAGRTDEVDGRSDVFALGVMLYELLTDALPWPLGAATTSADPVRPSARVTTTGGRSEAASPSQRRHRVAELRGDLDWITLKALARERGNRYATVTALLADLELHLAGRPVSAGPPRLTYRLRKLARRHRHACAWTAVLLLTVATGTAVAWGFRAEAADSDAARVQAIADTVARLQKRAVSAEKHGASHRVVQELLQDALQLYDRELREQTGQPELGLLRISLLNSLAAASHLLGEFRQAIQFAEESDRQGAELEGAGAGERCRLGRAKAWRELGRSHYYGGDAAKGKVASDQAVAALEQLHEADPTAHANVLAKALAEQATLCGRVGALDHQVASQQRAIEVLRSQHQARPDDEEAQRDLVRFHCGLSTLWLGRQQVAAAQAAVLEAQALAQSLPLITDEERALVSDRLARVYAAQEQPALAIPHAERAVQLITAVLEQHPERHQFRTNLVRLHALLFGMHRGQGDAAAADVHAGALLAMPEGSSPHLRLLIAQEIHRAAREIVDAMTTSAFVRADALLARAMVQLEKAVDHPRCRSQTVAVLALHGVVSGQLYRPWSGARWDQVIAEAEAVASSDWAAVARMEAAQRRLSQLDVGGARADLAALERLVAAGAPELDQLRLAIGLAAGDAAAAAAAAEALMAERAHQMPATNGLTRIAVMAGAKESVAARCRRRAIELCRARAATEGSRQHDVLARAQANVCLALLGEADAARSLPDVHQPALDALRGEVPASWWDEHLWWSGRLACLRQEAGGDGPWLAAGIATLAQQLQRPADLVALCEASLVPANGELTAVGVEVFGRAVDLGLRGRERILARAELAQLRANAAFQSLVARVPD